MIAPDATGSLLDLKRGTTLNLIDSDPDHPDGQFEECECPQHYRDSHPLGQAKHVTCRWPHGSLSTAADEYLLIGVLARNQFVASPLGLLPHVSASRNIYHCDPVPTCSELMNASKIANRGLGQHSENTRRFERLGRPASSSLEEMAANTHRRD
jgi:hypothetical protein